MDSPGDWYILICKDLVECLNILIIFSNYEHHLDIEYLECFGFRTIYLYLSTSIITSQYPTNKEYMVQKKTVLFELELAELHQNLYFR